MAKSGWFNGNPQTVLETAGDIVIDAFQYEMFSRDYENTLNVLNKPKERR